MSRQHTHTHAVPFSAPRPHTVTIFASQPCALLIFGVYLILSLQATSSVSYGVPPDHPHAVHTVSLYPSLVTRNSQDNATVVVSFLVFTRQSCQYHCPKRPCQQVSDPYTILVSLSLRRHMFEMEFQALSESACPTVQSPQFSHFRTGRHGNSPSRCPLIFPLSSRMYSPYVCTSRPRSAPSQYLLAKMSDKHSASFEHCGC